MFSKTLITIILICLTILQVNCVDPSIDFSENESAPNTISLKELDAGWILLFDGKTLEGWEDPAKEIPKGDAWIVEDGNIKANKLPRLREDLFTTQQFDDFELVFDWKISPEGNSGVKYRVQDRVVLVEGKTNPNAKRFEDVIDYELENGVGNRSQLGPEDVIEEYVIAYEYQIIDNLRHPDALENADRQSGAVYGMIAPSEQVVLPVGEFNQSRIVLRGNRVTHWLNGRKVVDIDLDSELIRKGLERRWGKDSPVYQLLTEMPKKKTPISLQHHNDEVWVRNIRIRHLD